MSIHAFTSCSFSYLNRARVLGTTLKLQHPNWVVWLVMVDKAPEDFHFDIAQEPFDRLLTVEDMFGEATEGWLFGHDIVEACTAVKGRASRIILDQEHCDQLFYFDPDIGIFNTLSPVVSLLNENSIVLTPHQTDPEPASHIQAIRDNEITSLDYGTFNLGFFAIRNDSEGRRFAYWWEARLFDWCHDDLTAGLFVDQKWCNLVPCFFDGVKILRDPGYNVASWNLSQRVMTINRAGDALINDHLLRFFHFTKLGKIGDTMTRRYAKDNLEIYELWWWYRNEVKRFTSPAIPKGWWYYGTFSNGIKISKAVRVFYRQRADLRDAFRNPFDTGPGTFFEWLQRESNLLEVGENYGFQPV